MMPFCVLAEFIVAEKKIRIKSNGSLINLCSVAYSMSIYCQQKEA